MKYTKACKYYLDVPIVTRLFEKFSNICHFRSPEKQTEPVEIFAKKILKSPRGEEYLDLLLRDCVREFPYREGTLFQQVKDNSPYINIRV